MKFIKSSLRVILVFLSIFAFISFANTKVFASSTVEDIEQEFGDLSTEEVVEIIIDEEINYIYCFSDLYIGINKFMVNNDYYIELTNRNNANYIIEEMLTRENLTDDEEYKLRLLIDMINNTISMDNVSQNLLTVYSNKNLYTPNGSIVEFAEYGVNTLSSDDITECHNDVKNWFSTLTDNDCVFPANNAYNCHSYAWYEQEPA